VRDHLHAAAGTVVGCLRSGRGARLVVGLALGLFLALGATAYFAESGLLAVDQHVQRAVIAARTGWMDTAMVWLTFLGTRWAIGALAGGIALWSWVTGRGRRFALVLLAAVALNPIFEIAFKELVDRARPDLAQLLPGNGPSFPSGHVLAAMGFYGLVPFFVWEITRRPWARIVAFAGGGAIALIVAFSRVYLDVHWATDATAGLLLGTGLVVASYRSYLRWTTRPVPSRPRPPLVVAVPEPVTVAAR